jgi:uncharacterized protein (DUF4415 family)
MVRKVTDSERAALEAVKLRRRPDSEIATSDAPERLDWDGAVRGRLYRVRKQQLTLRLDSDVVVWFKTHGSDDEQGYQTRINRALREYMATHDGE